MVWGEGLTVGALVKRVEGEETLGTIQALGTLNENGGVWVEWRRGEWCCEGDNSLACKQCKRLEGRRNSKPKLEPIQVDES